MSHRNRRPAVNIRACSVTLAQHAYPTGSRLWQRASNVIAHYESRAWRFMSRLHGPDRVSEAGPGF